MGGARREEEQDDLQSFEAGSATSEGGFSEGIGRRRSLDGQVFAQQPPFGFGHDGAAPSLTDAAGLAGGGAAPTEASDRGSVEDQVIPTPLHVLGRISPIFSPFFPVFCAFSPSRRGGSNEPQAGTQGQETVARAPKHRFAGLANSGCWERMACSPEQQLERRVAALCLCAAETFPCSSPATSSTALASRSTR